MSQYYKEGTRIRYNSLEKVIEHTFNQDDYSITNIFGEKIDLKKLSPEGFIRIMNYLHVKYDYERYS